MSQKEYKKKNDRVNQEDDEDEFEYKADKKDKQNSNVHQCINKNENENEEKKRILHRKLGHAPAKVDFNSDSESDPSEGYDPENFIKHHHFDDDMASIDNTTAQILQKLHFHRNVLKFVLGCIPRFDAKITAMRKKLMTLHTILNGIFNKCSI